MSYIAWHFLPADRRLGYGDNRLVEAGKTYRTIWPYTLCRGDRWIDTYTAPTLCCAGMHGSLRAIDALRYNNGPVVCQVEIYGRVQHGGDKIVGDSRKVLWMADATDVLYEFGKWCVLQVVDLWDAPQVVIDFLQGDESLRDKAASAASAAWVEMAVASAARARATWATVAASTASTASAAWAARKARPSEYNKQNTELEKRLMELKP